MSGLDETFNNESPECNSSTFDYDEQMYELQLINEILIETCQIEDTDRICKLIGETVHKLNKDCYVIVSLYDSDINAVRIRAAIGFESLTEKVAGINGKGLEDISFRPDDMEFKS